MPLLKYNLDCSKLYQISLISAGVCLLVNSSANAEQLKALNDRINLNSQNSSQILAQIPNSYCPAATRLYRYATTKNYFVQICASQTGALTYLAGLRNEGTYRLAVPIRSNSGQQFVAVNGSNRYILSRSYLSITQGSQLLVRERVLEWNEGRQSIQ